ncbi:MAG: flagellar hook-basal body complex protein FliE [Armatimonadetes bacterium]|nr:flagellar hook-basal body complex protein FliE [Armatimonadota bacterium]
MRIGSTGNNIAQLAQPPMAKPVQIEQDENFGQMLMDAIQEVNKSQTDSRKMQEDLMANRPVEYHDLMITMERASTAMSLTLQVRNKLLEAYQEINRMQV